MIFQINGLYWGMKYVPSTSSLLIDRTGKRTVACTDPVTKMVYISDRLDRGFMRRVVSHELAHCVLFSYGLLDDIHMMTKDRYIIDMEELICNIYADYGFVIQAITDNWMQIDLVQV